MLSPNAIRVLNLVTETNTFGFEDNAVANLNFGKPAYWSNCGNSNQPAGLMLDAVNRYGSIELAQADISIWFSRMNRDVTDAVWLDWLLPLNREAVMDLMRAYQNIGIMKSPDELAARVEKFEKVAA